MIIIKLKRVLLEVQQTQFYVCRVIVTFGLNALKGRQQKKKGVWGGRWNYSNAFDFIQYTVSQGYPVDSWEFGNLCL